MKNIIPPVDVDLLKSELTEDKFLRKTNHGDNEIYVVTYQNAPNVVREIGRLREEAFRAGGGGTGEPLDLDKFDTDEAYGYKQLVLWDPEAERVIGGYRYALCDNIVYDKFGQPILTSSHMFKFSKQFLKNYIDKTIELGRSFVTVDYQSTRAGKKSIFALDNLFDGLGALMLLHKGQMEFFFGKMTIYSQYPTEAREMIQVFLNKWFGAKRRKLIDLKQKLIVKRPFKYSKLLKTNDFREDYKVLKSFVMEYGVNIPPLVNSYMNLSPYMQYFGTGINDEFGDIYDSGILIPFEGIAIDKLERHVESLKKTGFERLVFSLRKKF
ncbi:MAG: GNAT family N-acetyltransferase [Bacteroidales bacterium]|nr:GNAT family N-acetyltransferase [Bacteroidales bacterium]